MKIHYKDWAPRADALHTVLQAESIIDEYIAEGLKLTLRQLYYQFVSRDLCANTPKEYDRLGSIVSRARMAGLLDWDAIEDRGRSATVWRENSNVNEAVSEALRGFRLERLRGQNTYVELWVEKDALSGVLERVAWEYHVPVMVNRGYSSASAMRECARRMFDNVLKYDSTEAVILYLGDLDPSGEDMVRDIRERIEMFANGGFDQESEYRENGLEDLCFSVEKLALNMDQVRQYNPPPNPAKMSDSRAAKYVRKHGLESWEVDALPPNVLDALIRKRLESLLDMPKMRAVNAEEKRQLAELKQKAGIR